MTRHSWPVFVAFLALYALGCARTVQGGDAGEFMTISALGGVAHPPGYPLFSLLLRIVGLLPIDSVPWKASFASALLAAGALTALHRALLDLTDRPLAAWAGVLALGLSTPFWRYATVAEVFSGGALTAALLLLVSARIELGWRGPLASGVLGLVVASGIANHHTVVLLWPLAVYAFVRSVPSWRDAPACVASCTLGQLSGLLPYLLLLRRGGGWRWGDTEHLDGLLHHLLRGDYGTFSLALEDAGTLWWEHPLFWLRSLPEHLVVVFLGLALVGAALAWRAPRRGLWLAVLATALFSGPIFMSGFNVPASGLGLVVSTRFQILPDVFVCALAGLGTAQLVGRFRPTSLLVALGGVAALGLHAPLGSHARWTVLDDYLRNTLEQVEPNALIIGAGDNMAFGMLYLQQVEGLRPDVVFVHPKMLAYPWYRAQVAALHPGFVPLDREASIPDLVRLNLDLRPIYLDFEHAGRATLRDRIPATYPEGGVLMRVSHPDLGLPPPEWVEAEMTEAASGYLLRTELPSRAHYELTWEGRMVDQYAQAWRTLATGFGPGEEAERCEARARSFSPFSEAE
jgi:hypothetical protein